MTTIDRTELTDEWLDANFSQTIPDNLNRIMLRYAWRVEGLVIIGRDGLYDVCITIPGNEYNSNHSLFPIQYQDQVERLVELIKDCEG